MKRRALLVLVATCAAAFTAVVDAQVDVAAPTNKHNLSITGPGPVKAQAETEICIFCHTPHNANPAVPLWNHSMSVGVSYQPYNSTTLRAAVGLPTGSTKLCLSCHDGTVAIGSTINNGAKAMIGVDGAGRLTGSSVLGVDLRDDHPVSFAPLANSEIVAPPSGRATVSWSSQSTRRAKPCAGSPSRPPNHGKIIGMPPRIGWCGANRLNWLVKISDGSPRGWKSVTCAP